MKKAICLFLMLALLMIQSVLAQDTIKVQGVAIDSKGEQLPDGEKDITFTIYDSPDSGISLWSEKQTILIKNGRFSTELGLKKTFHLPLDKQYWLAFIINDGEELKPRLQLNQTTKNMSSGINPKTSESGATTLAANTLDEAYDGGGSGLGRTITADAGAVNIAGSGGLTVEGAIGIGTTSPTQLLEIRKNALGVRMLVRNEGGGGGAGFEFIDDLSGANWKIKATQFGGFKIRDQANTRDVMGFDTNGNVGIGTLEPDARLVVRSTTGNNLIEAYNDGSGAAQGLVFNVERETGNVYAAGSFNPNGADVAEFVNMSESVEPGDVIEIDPDNPGKFRKPRNAISSKVAGIITTEPGVILGGNSVDPQKAENHPAVALAGRVPVKAMAKYGNINIGDLLVSSPFPGYAMKCPDPGECIGAIIGKAMEPLDEGVGKVMVQVMLR